MRAVVQRVRYASVQVDSETTGSIDHGLLVYIGIADNDNQADIDYIVEKIIHLRIFPDDDEKMNRSLLDVNGAVLLVSQFTLYGDARKGRRPSYHRAARPDAARITIDKIEETFRQHSIQTETGMFQAHMQVTSCNDGPVTILLDSEKNF
ncbi:D-aminoacyl-tRNA deacylase [Spirochaeta dissipatitropha]